MVRLAAFFTFTQYMPYQNEIKLAYLAVEIYCSGDLLPANNMLDQNVEVYGYPEVTLGEDQLVYTSTYMLDAGDGYSAYLWYDGSENQMFEVQYANQSTDSCYAVTVTDNHGCEASDTVKISFDLKDVGILSIQSPKSACVLSNREEITVYVKNFGTQSVILNDISVVVSVDADVPVTANKGTMEELSPGDSVEFSMGDNHDFSSLGDHHVSIHSLYAQDGDPGNDTMEVIITHFGFLEPDLGGTNDSLGTTLPLTLDAGADYVSYLWNGVLGDRTNDASQYGWYSIEVTDLHGCSGKDSLFLMPPTGIKDILLPGELKVFPVPTSRFLHIEYRYEKRESLTLDLYDSSGRKILIKQYADVMEISETIDVSKMAQGVYYLRLHSNERQLARQIAIH